MKVGIRHVVCIAVIVDSQLSVFRLTVGLLEPLRL
jgi:hypothetical protein